MSVNSVVRASIIRAAALHRHQAPDPEGLEYHASPVEHGACATSLPRQHRTHGKRIGVFVLLASLMALNGKLVVLGHQLEVVVDVMEQRHPAGLIIGTAAYRAVAVVLGLALGKRNPVLADLVRGLQQVAVALHVAQHRFAGIVGEERVDALGLEAGPGQGQPAQLGLHAIAKPF